MKKELANSITIRTPIMHRETHAMLHYLVDVHGILVEILLNMNCIKTKKRTREQEVFTKIIDYFRDWIAERSVVERGRS